MTNDLKRFSRGFSLLEILIVLAILGLLIIGSYLFIPFQLKKARDSRRKTDLERIKFVLYDYFLDSDCFPQNLPSCGQNLGSRDKIYLKDFPCDPKTGSYNYQVEQGSCPSWFKILTNLENTQDSGIDKVGCRYGCGANCKYNYGFSSTNILIYDGCITSYACSPSGNCIAFENPAISYCPQVFINDNSCENLCSVRKNRCHDERGKKN